MKIISVLAVIFMISTSHSAPPPRVPGVELDNRTYFEYITRNMAVRDTAALLRDTDLRQTDMYRLSATWASLPIYDQIAKDTTPVRYGMGAVFVPKMSAYGDMEPPFDIYNSDNELIRSGETGSKINLVPGKYTLKFVENTPFDISKEFVININQITPIFPSWACVRIEVIDETGKPVRGEYDLAVLNPLMSIGRGRGRDIDLAEDLRVWLLPIGNYKVLGVGSPLNSISNFLTFRVVEEGEFIRFTVVQDPNTNRILGGGVLIEDVVGETKKKNFSHTINIGGSIDFSYYRDKELDTTKHLTNFSLLLYDRFNYSKEKLEIMILLRIDVGFLIEDMKLSTIKSVNDELRVNSLFTYRVFSKLGPYGRAEFVSSMFKETADFDITRRQGDYRHAFLFYDDIPELIGDDTDVTVDSIAVSAQISPAFSPIHVKMGGGFNLQILKNRVTDIRFLSGFGVDYEKQWNSWRIVSERNMNFDVNSDIYGNIYNSGIDRINLERNDGERFDYGPEFMINYFAFVTKFVSLDGDVRLFMPVERFGSPDFRIHNLLSFRLTRYLNIDYDYKFDLIQASQESLRAKSNKHRLLARFSFARR